MSDTVKHWLDELTKSGVPILLCLTYADVLYLECKEDGVECDSELMVYWYPFLTVMLNQYFYSSSERN